MDETQQLVSYAYNPRLLIERFDTDDQLSEIARYAMTDIPIHERSNVRDWSVHFEDVLRARDETTTFLGDAVFFSSCSQEPKATPFKRGSHRFFTLWISVTVTLMIDDTDHTVEEIAGFFYGRIFSDLMEGGYNPMKVPEDETEPAFRFAEPELPLSFLT